MKFKKLFTFKPTEDGRSMVEMLGVLAIMGVLSIGGIAGYRYAVDVHRGNEVLNTLNMMAISFATQLESNPQLDTFSNEFDLSSLGITVDAYPSDADGIIAAVGEDADYITIDLNGMTPNICRYVLRNTNLNATILVDNQIFDGDDLDICDRLTTTSLWKNLFIKEAYAATAKTVRYIIYGFDVTGDSNSNNDKTTAILPFETTSSEYEITTSITTTAVNYETTYPVTTTPITTTPITTTPITTTPITTTAVNYETTTPFEVVLESGCDSLSSGNLPGILNGMTVECSDLVAQACRSDGCCITCTSVASSGRCSSADDWVWDPGCE